MDHRMHGRIDEIETSLETSGKTLSLELGTFMNFMSNSGAGACRGSRQEEVINVALSAAAQRSASDAWFFNSRTPSALAR